MARQDDAQRYLDGADDPAMRNPTTDGPGELDLAQMACWTAWVIRLTSHAATRTDDPATRAWLEGATEDAESLLEAVTAASLGWLDAGQVAIVRSVYDLWDANHARTERLVTEVDPIGHQIWSMRSAGARPMTVPTASEPALTAVG